MREDTRFSGYIGKGQYSLFRKAVGSDPCWQRDTITGYAASFEAAMAKFVQVSDRHLHNGERVLVQNDHNGSIVEFKVNIPDPTPTFNRV